MRKNIYASKKRTISLFRLFLAAILLFLFTEEIIAQKINSMQEMDKTTNNVSSWSNGSNEKISNQATDTTNKNIKDRSGEVISKQVKESNPASYNQNKIDTSKKNQERVELIDKREARSKTFLNADGSFTRIQSYGNMNYKDNSGKWTQLDGKLSQNKTSNTLLEISQTDLPISIDVNSGKTTMALEKDKLISFGNNVNLLVLDTSFNEVSRIASNNNNGNHSKEKEIKFSNTWNNIDRNQQVDFSYIKTDYVINQKPNYGTSNGFLSFEDKVELPAGWDITT